MQRIPVRGSATAGRLPFVDRLDQQLEVLEGRLLQDAVAQVEDVARASFRAAEDVAGALADKLSRPQQDRRVEVAPHAAVEPHPPPAPVEPPPPVQREAL